jgi:DNA-binding Lrp family transcriptional regulator
MAQIPLREYAKRHGVSYPSVLQKIRRGNLNAKKVGSTWLIDEFEPYIDRRKSGYNQNNLQKRTVRERRQKYVAFMKNRKTKELFTVTHVGTRSEFQKQIDAMTAAVYLVMNYKQVKQAYELSGSELEAWIHKHKNETVTKKRRAISEYVKTPGIMEGI